jgi:hypothetical protein
MRQSDADLRIQVSPQKAVHFICCATCAVQRAPEQCVVDQVRGVRPGRSRTTRGHQSFCRFRQGFVPPRAEPNRCGQLGRRETRLGLLSGGAVARRRSLPNLYGETGECPSGPYRPRHAAPPMTMRILRRAGLAMARNDRAAVAVTARSSVQARDAVLGMQVRWLEIVGQETGPIPGRRPRLSMIPAPVAAQVGGRRAW